MGDTLRADRPFLAILGDQLDRADRHCIFTNLIDADGENRQHANEAGLCIRVSLGTYKLFYEAGKEDFVFQRRSPSEQATLTARALARSDERRRSRWLK